MLPLHRKICEGFFLFINEYSAKKYGKEFEIDKMYSRGWGDFRLEDFNFKERKLSN